MKYISPKYEKTTIEVEDVVTASSAFTVEQGDDGVADFTLKVSELFKLEDSN